MGKYNWKQMFEWSHFTTNLVFGNFPYIMFLFFLCICYIANAHFAEGRVKQIQTLEKQIKELKWEYMSIKRDVLYRSMQSQLDGSVEALGLNLPASGPKVIVPSEKR